MTATIDRPPVDDERVLVAPGIAQQHDAQPEPDGAGSRRCALRPLISVALGSTAAASMAGGIFGSWGARGFGEFGVLLGVGWAWLVFVAPVDASCCSRCSCPSRWPSAAWPPFPAATAAARANCWAQRCAVAASSVRRSRSTPDGDRCSSSCSPLSGSPPRGWRGDEARQVGAAHPDRHRRAHRHHPSARRPTRREPRRWPPFLASVAVLVRRRQRRPRIVGGFRT